MTTAVLGNIWKEDVCQSCRGDAQRQVIHRRHLSIFKEVCKRPKRRDQGKKYTLARCCCDCSKAKVDVDAALCCCWPILAAGCRNIELLIVDAAAFLDEDEVAEDTAAAACLSEAGIALLCHRFMDPAARWKKAIFFFCFLLYRTMDEEKRLRGYLSKSLHEVNPRFSDTP